MEKAVSPIPGTEPSPFCTLNLLLYIALPVEAESTAESLHPLGGSAMKEAQ